MDRQTIIENLQNGWDLANRGRGWWLSAPRVDYKQKESYEIEESIIKAMKAEGILEVDEWWGSMEGFAPSGDKFDLPYKILWARLVKPTSEGD